VWYSNKIREKHWLKKLGFPTEVLDNKKGISIVVKGGVKKKKISVLFWP